MKSVKRLLPILAVLVFAGCAAPSVKADVTEVAGITEVHEKIVVWKDRPGSRIMTIEFGIGGVYILRTGDYDPAQSVGFMSDSIQVILFKASQWLQGVNIGLDHPEEELRIALGYDGLPPPKEPSGPFPINKPFNVRTFAWRSYFAIADTSSDTAQVRNWIDSWSKGQFRSSDTLDEMEMRRDAMPLVPYSQ